MSKTVKIIWNGITWALVAIAVVLAILLVGARLIGLRVFSVLSGSMEPTYHVGALIYVKNVDYTELESGDVITYMLDEDTVATHRIVGSFTMRKTLPRFATAPRVTPMKQRTVAWFIIKM